MGEEEGKYKHVIPQTQKSVTPVPHDRREEKERGKKSGGREGGESSDKSRATIVHLRSSQ